MLKLEKVTLVAMSCNQVRRTIKALQYSMKGIEFAEVILLTHKKPFLLPKGIKYKQIDKIKSIDDFNYKMIYELHKYIDTEFALLVHYDGFVVNPDKWRDDFLDYDYIGSPFPLPTDDFSYRDYYGNICRVGNSVSIRSKRLLEFPEKVNLPWESDHGFFNEDGWICCKNKHIIEENGMKIAPLDIAKYFGHENMIPEIEGIIPFVFHKWAGTNAKYPRF
ncbi:MAG: hypothetical protein JW924_12945 [Fusobacteriaceae bacterium]|nr:hypothetical protein [Fusobacteriaceae bacterium]